MLKKIKMVQLLPTNDNPTRNEIGAYAYICEMLHSNNYNVLNDVVREIFSKSGVGTTLHPAEEYFVNCFNNNVKNILLEDLRLPDRRYNFDKACND